MKSTRDLSLKLSSLRSALVMSTSIIAIGFALGAHADDSAPIKAGPPDRVAVEAARKTCEASSGLVKGTRPTKAQREAMHTCMKAAGFDRPPGPSGEHHGGRPPGPPPEGAPPGPPPSSDEAPSAGPADAAE